jgi:predicted ATPase/DNA-binding CsgD family transcriptional regulator
VLPLVPTPLIGRERDLRDLQAALTRPGVRLVTVVGTGGVGKTRLAIALAEAMQREQPGSVYFVSLSTLREPHQLLPAVAFSLGHSEPGGSPLARLAAQLKGHDALLVLDGVDHIPEAALDLQTLLDTIPDVKVLTTSREPLRLRSEHLWWLMPLEVPAPTLACVADVASVPAVELFVARATAVRADFELGDENAGAVAEICRRLDGLPLALELAAAWTRVFTPTELVHELRHRLALLVNGPRDLPMRHRTLYDTIRWSYERLDAFEQAVFRRFAVVENVCSVEVAESLCADDVNSPVLAALESLVARSLLIGEAAAETITLRMLETVREFAFERLVASGELDLMHGRLARLMLDRVESTADAISSPGQPDEALGLVSGPELEPTLSDSPSATSRTTLSRREREVAALVQDGYTNRQIAHHLVISERTAEAHVGSCLAKLGLVSRTQLARWSHRQLTTMPGDSQRPRPRAAIATAS